MSDASDMRMRVALAETKMRCADMGIELVEERPGAVEHATTIIVEWEAVMDRATSVMDYVWFDRAVEMALASREEHEAELSRGQRRSWSRLQECMVASTDVQLTETRDGDLQCSGKLRDMAILSGLDRGVVTETLARFQVLDRFGTRGSSMRHVIVRDLDTGRLSCIVRGSVEEIGALAFHRLVVDGAVSDAADEAEGRWHALLNASESYTSGGHLVMAYAVLDLDDAAALSDSASSFASSAADGGATTQTDEDDGDVMSELPMTRAELRACKDYALVGLASMRNEINKATREAILGLCKLELGLVFTSADLDAATLEGVALSRLGARTGRFLKKSSGKELRGVVRSAAEIARLLDEDLDAYQEVSTASIVFASTKQRDVQRMIRAGTGIDESYVVCGSPELLQQCTEAAFRVTTHSSRHAKGPTIPYDERAAVMREEAVRFHDADDADDVEDIAYGDMGAADPGDSAFLIAPEAHIDAEDPVVPLLAFVEYRQKTRFQEAQLLFETDPTPGKRIGWQLTVFWFLPVIVVAIWMMIPLSYSGGETQDFWAFAVWHTLYQIEATVFGIMLFTTTLPRPPLGTTLCCLGVVGVMNVAYLNIVWYAVDGNLNRLNVGPSTFPIALFFFLWYLLFLRNALRKSHQPEYHRGKRELSDRSRYAITYMIRSLVRSKQGRDIFLTRRLPVYMYDFALYVVIAACVLVLYYYCQLFTAFYATLTSEGPKIAVAFVYGVPIALVGNLMMFAADQLERRHLGLEKQGYPAVLVICIIEVFHQIFYKGLFTEVTELSTFFGLQLASAVLQFLLFPLRMSDLFFKLRTAFFRRFDSSTRVVSTVLGELGGVDVTIEAYRHGLVVEFCMVSMAQRIAATSFLVGLAVVKLSPNGNSLTLGQLDDDEFNQLLLFTLLMLAIEWGISTIIHVIIRVWHKFDALEVGGTAFDKSKCMWTICAVTTHILADFFIAINRLDTVE